MVTLGFSYLVVDGRHRRGYGDGKRIQPRHLLRVLLHYWKAGHNCLVWPFEYSLHPIAGAQKIYARASYL
jgi:hypothetical protein